MQLALEEVISQHTFSRRPRRNHHQPGNYSHSISTRRALLTRTASGARFLRTAAFLMPSISCFNNSEFAQLCCSSDLEMFCDASVVGISKSKVMCCEKEKLRQLLVDLAGSRFPTNTSFAPVPWWARVLSNRQDEPREGDSLSPLTVSLRKGARDLADAAGELALLGGDLLRRCPSRQELLLLRRDLMFWWDRHRLHSKWGRIRTAFDGTVRAIERCRKLQRPHAVVQLHIPKTAGSAMKEWAETTGFRVLEQTQQIKQGDGPYWIGTAGLPGSCRQRVRENRDRNTTWVAVERWLDLPLCDDFQYVVALREPVMRTLHQFSHKLSYFRDFLPSGRLPWQAARCEIEFGAFPRVWFKGCRRNM
ncbi:CYP704B1 [Symbiodinium sp. CCMP2592]|nr:CYP704B1 [Symbiodinium sp. CCMP2592]